MNRENRLMFYITRFAIPVFILILSSSCGGGGSGNDDTKIDTVAPIITIAGDNPLEVFQNDDYSDAGAVAVDDTDGTVSVIASGDIDTSTVGEYVITYTATDAAGNQNTTTRTVNVVNRVYSEPVLPIASEIVDLNDDGYNDLLISAWTDGVPGTSVLLNNGTTGFEFTFLGNAFPELEGENDGETYDYAPGDFNNDGHIDILAAKLISYATGSSVRLYLGDGNGNFTHKENELSRSLLSEHWLNRVSTADFDRDGNLDFVTETQECTGDNVSCGGRIYLGDGTGEFQLATISITDTDDTYTADQLSWGSYGDGKLRAAGVLVGDVDNDGDADLVATSAWQRDSINNTPSLPTFLNNSSSGNLSFQLLLSDDEGDYEGPEPFKFHIGALADINGDGFLDVFGTIIDDYEGENSQALLQVLLNDNSGKFIANGTFIDNTGLEIVHASGLFSADFDNNGLSDLFIANSGSDYSPFPGFPNTLLMNDGSTLQDVSDDVLSGKSTYTHQASVGDLNGDGYPDIFMNNSNQSLFTDSVVSEVSERLWINKGDGTFNKGNVIVVD